MDCMGKFEQSLIAETKKVSLLQLRTHLFASNFYSLKSYQSPDVTNLGKRSLPDASNKSREFKSLKRANSSEGTVTNAPIEATKSLEQSFSQVAGVPYEQRTGSGQVVVSHNSSTVSRGPVPLSDRKPFGHRCDITTDDEDFSNLSQRYRFMYTTMEERAFALDRQLLQLQKQICSVIGISEDQLEPVGIPSQEVVWVCGRICCDAADGKINKSSIILEGSRKESGGLRVSLEIKDEALSFSLFPGQIVCVQGINSNGRKMIAHRIVDGCLPKPRSLNSSKVHEYQWSTLYQGGKALQLFVASGPFTTSDNLDYQPIMDLLGIALQSRPDVVVLVGPFVDSTQPLVSNGNTFLSGDDNDAEVQHPATFEMIFVERIVRDCINAFYNNDGSTFDAVNTQIVLVPSLQDAHHEYVFPQPPFGDRDPVKATFFEEELGASNIPFSTGRNRRVHLMPNPCMFRVNDILLGVCSNDVLFSLSSDEVSQNLPGNRMLHLAGHLLRQQSFCPQFPLPTNFHGQVTKNQLCSF